MIESKSGVLHGSAGSRNNWARVCDTCRSAACTVYCRADSAYLCTGCDARIHAANCVASRHERVWVCEACERAPAAFFCKADSASLCSSCDSDIHSVNPLARRHQRVPILPIPTTLYGPPAADRRGGSSSMMIGDQARDDDGFLTQDVGETTVVDEDEDEDENEAASWLLPNPPVNNNSCNNNNNNSVDDYLDLVEYSSCHEAQDSQYNNEYSINQQKQHYSEPQKSYKEDSVVPVGKDQQQQQQYQSHHLNFQLGLDYDTSNTDYGYPASMSQNISVLSMDGGVVPESTMSQVSVSNPRTPKGTIDLFSGPPIQIAPQLTPMDREARVLRYREKKKTRKFEKTIRYASRKAYAETRPRVKGRFAKRTDAEGESDVLHTINGRKQLWIVPSF